MIDSLATLTFLSRSLSFFNTVALLWLGLTVVLNAERRTPGTLVASGGLLLGGGFFAVHSVLVSDVANLSDLVGLWWRGGWLPFVAAPYLWYLVMAWYSSRLSGHHRQWLILLAGVGIFELGPLLLANPLASYSDLSAGSPVGFILRDRLPFLVLIYPAYSVLCLVLALSILRRPASSERFMGEVARRRAQPWLVGASLTLLLVSLSVGAVVVWLVREVQLGGGLGPVFRDAIDLLLLLDAIISAQVALAVVLMGRAIVSYEIFTGKTLPRRVLVHDWLWSLALAAACGVLVAGSRGVAVDPTYKLLLATILLVLVYALAGWKSHVERERAVRRLRPLVASQGFYDGLLGNDTASSDLKSGAQLGTLCDEVLGARVAYLVALGPLAPLCWPPLAHPASAAAHLPQIDGHRFTPDVICAPVNPAQFGEASWAVSLWSDRGLIGLLLLGDKVDGGLYTQEEIEVARSACERLLDARASAELARRLMSLQRERLAETRVMDQRTRHLLHDELLPRIHAAMLALGSESDSSRANVLGQLADLHRDVAAQLRGSPALVLPEVTRLGLIGALKQELEGSLSGEFGQVRWEVDQAAEQLCEGASPLAMEVLFGAAREIARNAARHGRGGDSSRPLNLTVSLAARDGIEVEITDDGIGFDLGQMAAQSGGHGLVLHSTMLAVLGGSLTFESAPGGPTRAILSLPEHVLREDRFD